MRYALALFLALTGCASGLVGTGPDPAAGRGFRGIAHFSGDLDAQAFLESMPLTSLVKVHGIGSVTMRPFPLPLVTFDGDIDIIVEPIVGKESEAQEAVRTGLILIRRKGVPGALNAPGSIQSFKAAREKAYLQSTPPPPPPPEPLKVSAVDTELDPDATCVCDPNDLSCRLPRTLK